MQQHAHAANAALGQLGLQVVGPTGATGATLAPQAKTPLDDRIIVTPRLLLRLGELIQNDMERPLIREGDRLLDEEMYLTPRLLLQFCEYMQKPETISHAVINIWADVSLHAARALAARAGPGRLFSWAVSSGYRIDASKWGKLVYFHMRYDFVILILRVTNTTPGPDGKHEEHYLRVPATCRSALEAVAWTFGMTGPEYQAMLGDES